MLFLSQLFVLGNLYLKEAFLVSHGSKVRLKGGDLYRNGCFLRAYTHEQTLSFLLSRSGLTVLKSWISERAAIITDLSLYDL